MQFPRRKKEELSRHDESRDIVYLTPAGAKALDAEIKRLDTVDRPRAVKDVSEAVQKGDLSENAEYHEARARLSRTEGRIVRLREKRKRVEIIATPSASGGTIAIGSRVTLATDHVKERVYEIVGPDETDPSKGRISFRSPLGVALMGKKKGDRISLKVREKEIEYRIVSID
jgi:transcription elongation factor GreA